MGIAQGMDILLHLANHLQRRSDIGFLFVGRGSEVARLRALATEWKLNNVQFYDEIHPDEIPDLYTQCTAGIVALDPRHKSHNIPGKFLTCMQSSLPVLANVNAGNDLAQMIREEKVGQVCENNQVDDLAQCVQRLMEQIELDTQLQLRCRSLFQREFAVKKTVSQIVSALSA
jgi:glycosyltransferase involved in cell wall biosynthesis